MPTEIEASAIPIDLLARLSRPGPRYTSYPTAPVMTAAYTADDYISDLRAHAQDPLSLYFHIPFCRHVCLYCACNVIYTANRKRSEPYLELLKREIELLAPHARGPVRQLHWGGGTPTFLAPEQIESLGRSILDHFDQAAGAEWGVELDPRETTAEHIAALTEVGFNRASIGVQDFDPHVQRAIHRTQSVEMVAGLVQSLREQGYRSVNFDLIYGLPEQTVDGFKNTMRAVMDLRPDRISLFHFAHLPDLKKHQRRIKTESLPSTDDRLRILKMAVDLLLESGYLHIGMDHFALPEDELARAQAAHQLHRNFQGYTTHGECSLLGLGVTSIGNLGDSFAQNKRELVSYGAALREGRLPIDRGYRLSADDRLRRHVIMELMCHFSLNKRDVESRFGIDFESHFAGELAALAGFEQDGLVMRDANGLQVTARGRFAIRNICMTFDAHLEALRAGGQRFSKTV
ncbi:MAG: oxygen-independent coproporphyrinogen III oxidase [Spirochaetales bacterium]|nr:oxygen-independent coproporphyrinogen III oxidase [Spirochaetales bacterium]MCP5486433.1 oxygen-independent coproporphyrinogen III oxidase [Spirochaetales bacterium]